MKNWTDASRAELRHRWVRGEKRRDILAAMGITDGALRAELRRSNVPPRGRGGRVLLDTHPAMKENRTLFPSRVYPSKIEPLLFAGAYQKKLGAKVLKGPWKGMLIYSLTLEERATCPPDCPVLSACYGNNMPFAKRYRHGEELEARIYAQLSKLAERYPGGFVVRLHMLGDFYSEAYVRFWREALKKWPGLRIFGYTGWKFGTPIGFAINNLRRDFPNRFKIRTSGGHHGYRTIVIDNVSERRDAIVCPVETGRAKTCASCGLCWNSPKPIAFLRH